MAEDFSGCRAFHSDSEATRFIGGLQFLPIFGEPCEPLLGVGRSMATRTIGLLSECFVKISYPAAHQFDLSPNVHR